MNLEINTNVLFNDVSQLIDTARTKVAYYADSSLVELYWQIGNRINLEILNEKRADYGKEIVKNLAIKLESSYGRGFNRSSLFRMIQFVKCYSKEIVATLSRQFSWSKFIELIAIEDPLKRQFYTEMCRIEHWSVRDLRKKISGMLYERTAISHKPENVIKQELENLQTNNELTKDLVFRDPYMLDFLQLPAAFSESDLENAILNDLTQFLSELGTDFCFIARQKRITIDNEDYYMDLLAFHRTMRRMVVIELKLGTFKASYKGQMELYLRWLDKHERKEGEEAPLGLILCADKKKEQIELLELDKSGIHVAQYLTALPPRDVLEARLNKAIQLAQERNDIIQISNNEDGLMDD